MNSLLQESLMGTRHVNTAAIVKQKDFSIKAKSTNFYLSVGDMNRIEAAFENPRQARLTEAGITFLDVPYKAIRADEHSIYAKNDKAGVVIVKTNLYYILASYDTTMHASIAVEAVEKLGTFVVIFSLYLYRTSAHVLPVADYFRRKNK